MASLRNALEEIVVKVAQEQLGRLPAPQRQNIDISEVLAYALNRLPTMYASTGRGWLQQRKRGRTELYNMVVSAVNRSLMNVRQQMPRNYTSLALDQLLTPAHTLARLQRLFRKPTLRWRDLPSTFAQEIVFARQPHHPYASSPQSNANVNRVPKHRHVAYLGAQSQILANNLQQLRQKQSSPSLNSLKSTAPVEVDVEFESYMLTTTYTVVNVLEAIVLQESKEQLARLQSVLSRKVTIEESAAYALNRLPPMYATSQQGVHWQSQKAHKEMSNQIESVVIQSIMALSKTPRRLDTPLPMVQFDLEQEEAMQILRQRWHRNDITWHNVAPMMEEAITQERQGSSEWEKNWRMLGQIFTAMHLSHGDAELVLSHTSLGIILMVQVYTRSALRYLVETPQQLAAAALRFFPDIISIELHSPIHDFPITYTREEMIQDGLH
jgi:Late competence development protein ComFB